MQYCILLTSSQDFHLFKFEHAWPLASDVIEGLSKWAELFGKFPIVFFTDQGEFTDHTLVSFFHDKRRNISLQRLSAVLKWRQ